MDNHMEFSIALPPLVEQTNAGVEWNTMKQRLQSFLNPSSHRNNTGGGLRRPFLISIATEQVQAIFNLYNVSYDEGTKFCKILQNIEDLCLPRFLIIYNRFRFFTCKQNGPEFNGFLQQLLAWSDLCEFGDSKDILLKDCIISGVSEESVRQHLLRTEQLDFDKTVEICRAVLSKKQHTEDFLMSRDKILVNAATNTPIYSEDLLHSVGALNWGKEKSSVAVNTHCLQFRDESIQTSLPFEFMQQQQPLERDILMPDLHELKHLNLDEAYHHMSSEIDFHSNMNFMAAHGSSSSSHHHGTVAPQCTETMPMIMPESLPVTQNNHNTHHNDDFIRDYDPPGMSNLGLRKSLSLRDEPLPPEPQMSRHNNHDELMNMAVVDTGNISNIDDRTSTDYDNRFCVNLSLNHEVPVEKSDASSVVKTDDLNVSSKVKSSSRLQCRACKASFKDLQALHEHKKTHEGEKKYKCDICSAKFYNTSHLKVHKRLHTGERPYVCDTCGESFVEASKLKAHARKHTGERPYECKVCGMTFAWSAAFSRHKRVHTGEKPYVCQYCPKKFSDFTGLQRHVNTHTRTNRYKCRICYMVFNDPSALRSHKKVHTGERSHHCEVCGSSFTRAQHVRDHMKLHLGEKPFKCEVCGSCFVEASKLKSHMRKHTGEKPYSCGDCGASFAWKAAYTRHMRTHTLEKPYSCKFCGCTFADNSTLVRHHRTHTGEKPYRCTHCGATFADSSTLSRHQVLHSGKKAYTCEVCDSSFAIKSYLKRHMRTHTGERPHACDKCGSKFADVTKLKRHKKIHDKDKIPDASQEHQQHQQQQHHNQHQHLMMHDTDNMTTMTMNSMPLSLQPPPPVSSHVYHHHQPMSSRHEMPHFHEDELLSHLDHTGKGDHHHFIDPMHEHDIPNALSLPFSHGHDEHLDLSHSVSLGIASGMDSFANILSFDS